MRPILVVYPPRVAYLGQAQIVIDQATLGPGTAGVSRDDGVLAQVVTLRNSDNTNVTAAAGGWRWSMEVPRTSAATLSTPNSATCTFTPDVEGTYKIKLLVNEGIKSNQVATLLFAVRNSDGIRWVGQGEAAEANWLSSFTGATNTTGWWEDLVEAMKTIAAAAAALSTYTYATITDESANLPNSRRLAAGADVSLTDAGAGSTLTLGTTYLIGVRRTLDVAGQAENIRAVRTFNPPTVDAVDYGQVNLGSESAAGRGTTAIYAKVGGGLNNLASGTYSTIAGGRENTASGDRAFVGGGGGSGAGNTASGTTSCVVGGVSNSATGSNATVGGGSGNQASQNYAVVCGGLSNTASGSTSSVVAGNTNAASGIAAFIGNGSNNAASGIGAFIGNGSNHIASGDYCFVGAGQTCTVSATRGAVVAGFENNNAGHNATISGGYQNSIVSGANYSSLAGGRENQIGASGVYAFIGAGGGSGVGNTATAIHAVVVGGSNNDSTATHACVVGGNTNANAGDHALIGAGTNNDISSAGDRGFIGAGNDNTVSGADAAAVAGTTNTASGARAFVGAGNLNTASGVESVVGGGESNTASGANSAIGGGEGHTVAAAHATVAGGYNNDIGASGTYGSIPGGRDNVVSNADGHAWGRGAIVSHDGAIVINAAGANTQASAAANEITARGDGGIRLITNGANITKRLGSSAIPYNLEAQGSFTTTDDTFTTADIFAVPTDTACQMRVTVVGKESGANSCISAVFVVGYVNDGGTVTNITPNISDKQANAGAAGWSVSTTLSATHGQIEVQGAMATAIIWTWYAEIHIGGGS